MSKLFKESFIPISIEVENIKGEKFTLKTQFNDVSDTKKVESMIRNIDILQTEKIIEIMTTVFGETPEFFEQFSIQLLTDISKYIAEETKKKEAR